MSIVKGTINFEKIRSISYTLKQVTCFKVFYNFRQGSLPRQLAAMQDYYDQKSNDN